MSAIGSFFYVLGSIGFFPSLINGIGFLGPFGFILGSFIIGTSQLCKTVRIGFVDGRFSPRSLIRNWDSISAVAVELGAGIGAWFFFIGTIIYCFGPYYVPVTLWMFGSIFFFLASCSLAIRHFILKL